MHKFTATMLHRKRQLGRSSLRWKDNTKMDFREIVCKDVNWL